MPLDLAAKMGAAELLGVDVDGIGIVRPNTTGLPTRIVRSHWDLGPTLDFDPARAGRNIALGGVQDASGHYDLVTHAPCIYVDNRMIMDHGQLTVLEPSIYI